MSDFSIVHLKDLCTDVVDCPHSSPKWLSHGIPVIRNYNIVNGTINMDDLSYVDDETYKKRIKRAIPSEDDIVISREAPMGVAALIPPHFKCCMGQRLVLLKVNKEICNPRYLLYAIMSDYVQQQIRGIDRTGSIVSNLNIPDLENLMIPIVPLNNQKEIAYIIGTIDNKINHNNTISSQLESLAKTIYDYWFLQFDFPDENGRPYKSSGGKMVWNEELKRKIPEGWKIIKLSDIADLKMESLNPANYPTQYFWHYSIPSFDDFHYPAHELGATINSSKYVVPTGSILVSKLNPQFKRVWNPQKYGSDCICSTEFLPFVPRAVEYKGYLYILLNSDAFQQFMIQSSSSSTGSRKRMQPELCGNFTLAFPADDSLIKMFSGKIAHILNMLTTISEENRQLSSLRDFLLPMLMNGQVTFKEGV